MIPCNGFYYPSLFLVSLDDLSIEAFYPGEREAPFLRVSVEFHIGTKTERSLCSDDPVVVMKTKGRAQLPVPLFSYATFLAYFMARRFQETGISHRIDVNVDVTVEEK